MFESKKILIIDDEVEVVKGIEIKLKDAGYDTVSAYNGMDGLEKAKKEKPDLIILDVVMPMIDGFGVCHRIKESEDLKLIPIIFLTIKKEPVDQWQGLSCGAVVYITKPFEFEDLLGTIKEILNLKERK